MHRLNNQHSTDNRAKIRIQIQHHENSTQHTDSADKKVIRSFKCQLADFHDIACNARQQLSCTGIIKKAEGHFFHMSEQIATHIVLNAGTHHMTIIVNCEKQSKVDKIQYYQYACPVKQLVKILLWNFNVEHLPYNIRKDQLQQGREARAYQHQKQNQLIGLIIMNYFF